MSESIRASVGSVLRNVSNYPRGAQARLMGQDLEPLIHKATQAVLLALAAHDAEVRAQTLVQVRQIAEVRAGVVAEEPECCASCEKAKALGFVPSRVPVKQEGVETDGTTDHA